PDFFAADLRRLDFLAADFLPPPRRVAAFLRVDLFAADFLREDDLDPRTVRFRPVFRLAFLPPFRAAIGTLLYRKITSPRLRSHRESRQASSCIPPRAS